MNSAAILFEPELEPMLEPMLWLPLTQGKQSCKHAITHLLLSWGSSTRKQAKEKDVEGCIATAA